MSDDLYKVCVIGGGVSGLTTALTFLRAGHFVNMMAESKKNDVITSTTAAAFWYPFWVGTEPDHSWYRPEWAFDTLFELEKLTHIPEASVSPIRLIEYFPEDLSSQQLESILKGIWWRRLSFLRFNDYPVEGMSVQNVSGTKISIRHCAEFDTYVINMPAYLPYLHAEVGQYEQSSVENRTVRESELDDLLDEYDFVIVCTGLGAADLVADPDMEGVRGVVVRMPAQNQIQKIKLIHTGDHFGTYPLYMVPRLGRFEDLILGGTLEGKNQYIHARPKSFEWNQTPVDLENIARSIIKLNSGLEPMLQDITPLGVAVGYRPRRSQLVHYDPDEDENLDLDPDRNGVRLSPDWNRPNLIYNYGHAGGGVTLSWGCANEVLRWANRIHAS